MTQLHERADAAKPSDPAQPHWSNMVELARYRATKSPNKPAYLFLEDGEGQTKSCTYAELDAHARRIANQILNKAEPGSRVLLLYPPGIEYVAGFFGCLYAGVVAVPAYPPTALRQLPRLEGIARDSGARLALSVASEGLLSRTIQESAALRELAWIYTDDAGPAPLSFEPRQPAPDDLAMLQYTSGSTGDPKGVMVMHRNLIANSALIQDWLKHPRHAPGVTWLPPYHDMGLIGGILQPLYAEFLAIMLSPLAFVQRPLRWLRAISHYRAAVSGGPNFAYELCVRSTTEKERRELDLTCWTTAFCGAEPINPETVARFNEAFAASGFRSRAFFPAYGLAEATLAVSGKPAEAEPKRRTFASEALDQGHAQPAEPEEAGARTIMSCGVTLPGAAVVIVDPDTRRAVEPGRIGEVWLRGAGVTRGYWNRTQETLETFDAYTADGEGPWMRTGDMAFLHEGELYVTGRLKDLVIIRGKKFSPIDIERAAERGEKRLRPGSTVAFSVPGVDSEELVLVGAALTREPAARAEIVATVRRTIASEFQLAVHDVRLVAGAAIPTTSSGKLRRSACRKAYRDGSLKGEP